LSKTIYQLLVDDLKIVQIIKLFNQTNIFTGFYKQNVIK